VSIIGPVPTTQADNIEMNYDGASRRVGIAELHGSTVLANNTFVWCRTQLCEERNQAGNTGTKQFFAQGEQVNGTNYYYAKDHLGSVREMTDGGGTIHSNYDYDPYGVKTKLSGDLDSDFGYTGFYVSVSCGLDLTHYRAYDSNKGNWLSRDPKGESEGLDLYEYGKDNPLVNVDPEGLSVFDCTRSLKGSHGLRAGPFYHEYLCVNGSCWGLSNTKTLGLIPGPGVWEQETMVKGNDTKCSQVSVCKKQESCFEQCILSKLQAPAPTYELVCVAGQNCQSAVSKIISECQAKCKCCNGN
jgi:RHS repeat-associated protein